MNNKENFIGYIKYEGSLVEDGLMDARKQAKALTNIDSAFRFLITKQAPALKNIDYEVPVLIRKGSWEMLIPSNIAEWAQAGLGLAITTYLTAAAKKMADNDFENVRAADLFRKSLDVIKWFVRIVKHFGDATIKSFDVTKFKDDNKLVGLKNQQGEVIYVPKDILDLYIQCKPTLLNSLSSNITKGRELVIATKIDGVIDEVKITTEDKYLFCPDEDEDGDEALFPELIHGSIVELEGEVTRENKTTNSMGFKYNGHILTAYPSDRNIVPYKPYMFLKCKISAYVDRSDDDGTTKSNRPKLIFDRIEEINTKNKDLFD
jgi:hypothetical protein